MSEKSRIDLWSKLNTQERSFSWFHRGFLSGSKLSYNTLYKQAKGQELTNMSDDLKTAINKYTGETCTEDM